jgi:hypothetical protein
MMINHLRLKRRDGSEFRQDDVQASGDVHQRGATIELSIPALGVIRATVDRVDDQTTVSKIGDPNATGQLTVWAIEVP